MSNFTNLKNSYMYGHANRQNNYFQNYNNFENDIEDPIYTGFTLSIDSITSPLFFKDYENNDGLLGRIQSTLESAWNNINSNDIYSINSHIVRDEFPNGKNIGYGLQENVFSEELLYGAVDYIYMVDKVADGEFDNSSRFLNNEDEITNNGTSNNTTNNSIESNNELDDNEKKLNEINKKIEEKKQEILNADKDLSDFMNSFSADDRETYINQLKQQDAVIEEYKKCKKGLDDALKSLNSKKNVINNYQSQLENIKSQVVDSIKNKDGENINVIYNNYNELKNKILSENLELSIPEKLNDKNLKKSIAKDRFGNENMYKKLNTDQKVEMLCVKIDMTNSLESENQDYNYYLDRLNKEVEWAGNEILNTHYTLQEIYDALMRNPSDFQIKKNNLEKLKNELSDLMNEAQELKTTSSSINSISETNNEVTPTSQETYLNNSNNQYDSNNTDANIIPQTVLDMVDFTSGMKRLTENYPYVFLSVNGLDTAYRKYHIVKDAYYGSGDDTISIDCLESLDMKVSSMFNKYFNAVYDRQYRRERLPINLRRFNCSIFVHDIRNFRESLSRLKKGNFDINSQGDNTPNKILELALNYLSVVEFKFFDCEIDPENTGGIFESISNENVSESLRTKFTFKYGNCVINYLPFGDLIKNYNTTNSSSLTENNITKNLGEINDTTSKQSTIQELGKINMSNKPFDFGKTTDYRSYWDRSELGNVNNDDYKEYHGPMYSHSVADDYIRNRYANMFVNNSAVINQQATDELDNALHRTIMGISASIGKSPTTIADALGVGYLNNVWNPKPKHQISYLGNVDLHAKPGISNDESETRYEPIKPIGSTNDLGNYDLSSKTGDMIKDLGYYDLTKNPKGITNDLGNYDLTRESNGNVEDLGIQDLSSISKGDTKDLGQYDLTKESKDITNELGKYDLTKDSIGDTKDLGQYDLTKESKDTSNNIGVIDINGNMLNTTEDLGKFDMSQKSKGDTTNLGIQDLSFEMGNTVEDLGKFDLEKKSNGTHENLGKFDLSGKVSNTTIDLGKFDLSAKSDKISTDIGKFNLEKTSTGETTDLGTYDLSGNMSEPTKDLGKFNIEKKSTNETTDLGIYDLSEKIGDMTNDLGKFDLSSKTVSSTTNLGKFDLSNKSNNKTTDLGKFDLSAKSGNKLNNLGKFDIEKKSDKEYKHIGNVDLNGNMLNTTKDLGKFNLERTSNGETDDLGTYDLSSKNIGETIDLGKFDLSAKSGENTYNLGKFNLDRESTGETTDLGTYNLSYNEGKDNFDLGSVEQKTKQSDKTQYIDKQTDKSEQIITTYQNLGNVFMK